jgi:2-phospho-L-lactate guanylyltransferase
MSCWAIIPAKSLSHGKSRLAGLLGAEQRAALNRRLFGRALDAVQGAPCIDRIAVVTGDAFLLALVRGQGLHGLEDHGGGLNAALALGTRYAIRHGAQTVLVLSCDLPAVTAADVTALAAGVGGGQGCVIAPDDQEEGTNALALNPPDPEFFRFGPDSFQAHLAAAKVRKLKVRVLRRPGLAHDLDTPDNYRQFAKGQVAPSGAPA